MSGRWPGATTLIAELLAPRQLHFREQVESCASLEPDGVFARTLCTAVSVGTEVAAYTGLAPLRPGKTYPRLLGYCNVAQVESVGAQQQLWKEGDRILSFQSHRSGFVGRESDILTKVPSQTSPEDASITYLLQLAYNSLLKGGFVPGHRVVVIGLGTIGLGAVTLASMFGGQVAACSDQPANREVALELGAQRAAGKSGSDPLFRQGADLVITTSNKWDDWKLAIQAVRREGTIAVLGFPGRGLPLPDFNPLDSQFFYDKQLRIVACGMSPESPVPEHESRFSVQRNMAYLLDLISEGRIPIKKLVDGIHSWRELPEVYAMLERRDGRGLSRIIRWT